MRPSNSERGGRESAAFAHLHPRVQRWVWEKGWTDLRDIQEEAIDAICATDADVIIAAATASGKTEAAFLPICSRLVDAAGGSIRALYVSPLKALINDQFARLDGLCEHLAIPVHRWHGDVGQAAKKRTLRDPSGLLLITPESLEALFVIHGPQLATVFHELQYVVVDELHAFPGSERGRQLQSLLHRIEVLVRRRVRRIGLSATLGDMGLAAEFLRPGGRDATRVLVSQANGHEIRLQIRGYVRSAPSTARDASETDDENRDGSTPAIADHLFATLRGTNNLIFANRRAQVEQFADLLRRRCEHEHLPNEFWPHHGSLGRDLRHDVEARLHDRALPVSVVCTSTLEMGIDIGSMASVAQLGSPPSVASLRQRLGRSGRRGEPAVLRIYVQADAIDADAPPHETLYDDLVQSIAMVRLLLARWCEPPDPGRYHFSTLVQQVLSLIAQHGGIAAADAWRVACKSGPFRAVDAETFATLLRELARHELIMQASDGLLLLGRAGERLVEHYSFYAAFNAPEEFRLVASGRTLGTLPISQILVEGMFLVFAGRRWRIEHVDRDQRVIELAPAPAGRVPKFESSGGPGVHDRIRDEMRAVYTDPEVPVFLDSAARTMLGAARANYVRLGLDHRTIVEHGAATILFPWLGSRAAATLALQLHAQGLRVGIEAMALVVDARSAQVRDALRAIAATPADALSVAKQAIVVEVEKHDGYVPADLQLREFAARSVDLDGARKGIERLLGS